MTSSTICFRLPASCTNIALYCLNIYSLCAFCLSSLQDSKFTMLRMINASILSRTIIRFCSLSIRFYNLNLRLKSEMDALRVFLFHSTHFANAPGVSGLFQCSPIPLCLFRYSALRLVSLCLVKSDIPLAPNGTVFVCPSGY